MKSGDEGGDVHFITTLQLSAKSAYIYINIYFLVTVTIWRLYTHNIFKIFMLYNETEERLGEKESFFFEGGATAMFSML